MDSKATYADRVVKGTVVIFLSALIAKALGYALRLFFSRTLTVEEFGLLYAALVFIGFFGLFRDLGLSQAIVKRIPEFIVKNEMYKTKSIILFSIIFQLLISIAIVAPIFVFSDQIAAAYFHISGAGIIVQILCIMFLANIFVSVFQSALQGMQRMVYYSIVEPLTLAITFIFSAALVSMGGVGGALGYMAASLIMAPVAFFLVLKTFPDFFRLKSKIDKPFIFDIFSFSVPVFLGFVGSYILAYTDTIVITFFRSVREVAWYQVALSTSQILWITSAVIGVVTFPLISEMWAKKEKSLLSSGIGMLIKFLFVLILPFVLIMVAFPNFILDVLFGPSYLGGVVPLQILSISAIFVTLWCVSSIVLSAVGKPAITTKIVLFVAVFNLVMNVILVQYLGISGVAIATLASFIIAFALSTRFLKQHVDVDISFLSLFKAGICGALMLALIFFIKGALNVNPWIEVAICLVVGLGFYVFIIFLTRTLTKKELSILTRINLPIPAAALKIASKLARG